MKQALFIKRLLNSQMESETLSCFGESLIPTMYIVHVCKTTDFVNELS